MKLFLLCLLLVVSPSLAATNKGKKKSKEMEAQRKREWEKDPKHCEVCMKVMTAVHTKILALPKKERKNKDKIETMVDKFCSKKNKEAGPKERKLCYYLLPVKRSISTPFAFGADPKAVCRKLERASAEVCTIKVSVTNEWKRLVSCFDGKVLECLVQFLWNVLGEFESLRVESLVESKIVKDLRFLERLNSQFCFFLFLYESIELCVLLFGGVVVVIPFVAGCALSTNFFVFFLTLSIFLFFLFL